MVRLARVRRKTMSEKNKDLICRWFEEVWNKARTDVIAEMLDKDCVIHGLSNETGEPLVGAAAFREFHKKFYDAFPNIVVTVEDTIAEGDTVVARCSVRGQHTGDSLGFAATNKPILITGVAIVRVKDGKFVEVWNNFDFLSMYQQIGMA